MSIRRDDPTSERHCRALFQICSSETRPNGYRHRLGRKIAWADPSDMHRGANPACVAEYPQITLDFRRITGAFFRIVREFYRRPAVDRRHLADDRDRIKIDRAVRRASHEIIGQVGAPAETYPHPAREMTIGLFDRSDVHAVGKNQELLLGIAALLLPPLDDFFAGR